MASLALQEAFIVVRQARVELQGAIRPNRIQPLILLAAVLTFSPTNGQRVPKAKVPVLTTANAGWTD